MQVHRKAPSGAFLLHASFTSRTLMDWTTALNVGALVAVTMIGGYVRFVQSQLDKARTDLASIGLAITAFRIEVAEKYVRHENLRRIEDALVRIETKLDSKQDKA